MSVKIKINWDNENVVSESVRIYRADSAFTSNNLPPLLAEIVGDVYEYEDLSVIRDQTYFYMLSAKLGEQEVFTECFEIVAEDSIDFLQLTIPAFNASTIVATYLQSGNFASADSFIFNNISGEYIVGGIFAGGGYGLRKYSASGIQVETFSFSGIVDSFALSKNGKKLFIRSGATLYQYNLTQSFILAGAVIVGTFNNFAGLNVDNSSTIFVNEKVTLSKIYSATTLILTHLTSAYDLSNVEDQQEVDVLSKLTLRNASAKITSMLMSDDGLKLLLCTGSWYTTNQRFHVLNLSTAFDLTTASQSSYKDLTFNFTRGTPMGFNSAEGFIVVGDASGGLLKLKY